MGSARLAPGHRPRLHPSGDVAGPPPDGVASNLYALRELPFLHEPID